MESYYRVDRNLRIIDAGGDWDDFARQNNGDACLADDVKDTLLLHHIKGDTPRMWVETVVKSAFALNSKTIKPYRCDSDRVKRELVMEVFRDGPDTALIRHRIIREEKMPDIASIVFFPSSEKRKPRCSVCNKMKIDDEWVDPFDLTERQQHHVIYDVCGPCGESVFGTA